MARATYEALMQERCGKTKYIRYVNWGDPKHKGARLRVPLETQDGPPPPPRARMAHSPRVGSLTTIVSREGGRGSDAPLSPASLSIHVPAGATIEVRR